VESKEEEEESTKLDFVVEWEGSDFLVSSIQTMIIALFM
jgi:hypothetical protein